MKKIVYLLLFLWCQCSCSDELLDGPARPVLAADSVRVTLGFNSLSFESPFSAGTRSAGTRTFTVSPDGVEAELVEMPVPLTRSGEEDKVYGFWVLQFDGTAATSVMTRKAYYNCPSGTLNSTSVTLNAGTGQQRIVVIANAGSGNNNSISPIRMNLTQGTSTYNDLLSLNYFPDKTDQTAYPLYRDRYPDATNNPVWRALRVMCGVADAKITAGMSALYISLRRNVSKITILPVELDASLRTGEFPLWQASLVNIPASSYLLPMGRGSFFPGTGAGYTGHQWPSAPVAESYTIPQKTFDVSVNLFPSVAGLTLYERQAKAPVGSTQLQVMGYKIEYNKFDSDKKVPIIKRSILFHIPLGTNFTDNFSIPPNHDLTYRIRLKKSTVDGSAGETRFEPGYFGGILVGLDKNGTEVAAASGNAKVWRFSKKIEVYPQNNRCLMLENELWLPSADKDNVYFGRDTMRWKRNGYPSISFAGKCLKLMDGFENSRYVSANIQSGHYMLVASLGYRLENEISPGSDISKPHWWYAPAIGQLIGIWIAGSGLISTMSGNGFWSSTLESSGNQAYIMTLKGEVRRVDVLEDRYHGRAVRNLLNP
ncbi:hypothetical protein [Culturomica sp.]|uniref:hypothetical protein n=1 Tax=Culturomica sp. TaxID=1926652 RepID=UPI0025797BA4|nr:hypothetical protein [Culturomica sp.]